MLVFKERLSSDGNKIEDLLLEIVHYLSVDDDSQESWFNIFPLLLVSRVGHLDIRFDALESINWQICLFSDNKFFKILDDLKHTIFGTPIQGLIQNPSPTFLLLEGKELQLWKCFP